VKAGRDLEGALRAAGFRGALRPAEPLAPYTTWNLGGPAELLALPEDREDLLLAVAWALRSGVPWRVLGNGSNLLVRDAGVKGVVLRVRRALDRIERLDEDLAAGGGASFPALARRAAQEGLAGLEFAGGIPGTVGGAVVMNAGWHEFETGPLVASVEFLAAARLDGPPGASGGISPGSVVTLPRSACGFAYRTSRFRTEKGIVLGARFRLAPGAPGEIAARTEEFARRRRLSQPTDLPSCGSVYLKPEGDFAGRLIEAAGLKGARCGGIEVSRLHANFFINTGGGTASEALELMERVEAEVLSRFGVRLTREVEIWGA
jgi:UDP-N-acetylmuramate dehydrogenase